jgi:hypothetical protein
MPRKTTRKITPKAIVIIVGLVFVLGIVLSTIILLKQQDSDSVNITNVSKYTSGKAQNDKLLKMIRQALFAAVKNTSGRDDITSDDIKDAMIRDNSYLQSYDDNTDTNKVEFIVDIASFKQSYRAYYEWESDKNTQDEDEYIGEYGSVTLECLPKDLLIYGDFKCIDESTPVAEGGSYDPILEHLPYDATSWNIYAAIENDKIVLHVNMAGASMHVFITEEEYEEMVRQWFNEIGLDYDGYIVDYSWSRN